MYVSWHVLENNCKYRLLAFGDLSFFLTDNPLVTKISAMKIGTTTTTAKTKLLQDEKPSKTAKPESESSESESDESESDNEETKGNAMSNEENKVMAPIEVKAEFIQCVMSGNYTKAQEICKQSKYQNG